MSRRKRSLETISFEVAMTTAALLALLLIIAPSLVVLIVSFTRLDRPCAIAICRLSCNACRLQRKRRPVTAPKMKCSASGH